MGQIKQPVILMNVEACFVSVREALGIVRLIKEKKNLLVIHVNYEFVIWVYFGLFFIGSITLVSIYESKHILN